MTFAIIHIAANTSSILCIVYSYTVYTVYTIVREHYQLLTILMKQYYSDIHTRTQKHTKTHSTPL